MGFLHMMEAYLDTTLDEVSGIRAQLTVLLVTATATETSCLHKALSPLPGKKALLSVAHGNQTYYLAQFGRYGVVHVQCDKGSTSASGSITTVSEAIDLWKPKAVLMIGIAFGADSRRQQIGDVLVSKTVIPYEMQRLGKLKKTNRSPTPPCSALILNRFVNHAGWGHALAKGNARVSDVDMLSGEKLVDDPKFKRQLLERFPTAQGGEMEGAGVYAAAHSKRVEWIIVKAICDWGDGKKAHNKKKRQLIAATSAVSLCKYVLSKPNVLAELECAEVTSDCQGEAAKPVTDSKLIAAVLFDRYETRMEKYYFVRKADGDLSKLLKAHSIWVTGPVGCGKTSAVARSLALAGKPFLFMDLSRCVGTSNEELFHNFYLDLCEQFASTPATSAQARLPQTIQSICRLLDKKAEEGTTLFLDEIPIETKPQFSAFTDTILAILIGLSKNKFASDVRFALTSIDDPRTHIKSFQKKAYEKIMFTYHPAWTAQELNGLLALISSELRLALPGPDISKIVAGSEQSPRALKMIVRTLMAFAGSSDWPLERIIHEARIQYAC
jgi:nucleoside phosphorylase